MSSLDISSLFSVRGKVALVTGGSRGIGEMISAGLLANGAKVYITARKAEQCNATAERLSAAYNAECISIPANIADMAGVEERNALRIGCTVNGEQRQDTVITDMIFSIDQIVSYLSSICELYPGDIIYTGSPAGVGHGFKPPVYLKSGDVVETTLEGVGTMRHHFV